MPVIKLTVDAVKNASPLNDKQTVYYDTDVKGFALKVTAANSKIFNFQYKLGGRSGIARTITIGKYPTINPFEARKIALQYAGEVAQKKDPFAHIKEVANTKLKERENSFGQLFEIYDSKQLSQTKSGKDIKSIFMRSFLPSLQDTPIISVNRTDISKIISRIQDRGEGYAANKALSKVKTFFRWLVSEGYLPADPLSVMQKPFKGEIARDRVLSPDELQILWQEFDTLNCRPIADILKLLLLLGQRRNEVAKMKWAELDLKGGVWSLPREATKNKLPHIVPLSGLALDIIKAQKRLITKSKKTGKDEVCAFVFSTTGKTPVSGWSKSKTAIDTSLTKKKAKIIDWRIHDLRRTVSTNLGDLGYHDEDIGLLLNHTSRGITAVYNRSTYFEKKKEMLKAWHKKLAKIIPEIRVL